MVEDKVREWLKAEIGEEVWVGLIPPEDRVGVSLRRAGKRMLEDADDTSIQVYVFKRSYAESVSTAESVWHAIRRRAGFEDGWAISLVEGMVYEGVDLAGRYVHSIIMTVKEEYDGS